MSLSECAETQTDDFPVSSYLSWQQHHNHASNGLACCCRRLIRPLASDDEGLWHRGRCRLEEGI